MKPATSPTAYDTEARRDTPLSIVIADAIRARGPISVDEYMQICLQDPTHGYYRSKAVLGAGGDFVTAPEISQMFGELIGLWSAIVWQQMGSPSSFNLVELGPGRGTMMADMLRAVRRVPGYLAAADVICVETSEILTERQRTTLRDVGCPVSWTRQLKDIPAGPMIVIGNEFLDALPAAQTVYTSGAEATRQVSLDGEGRLVFSPTERGPGFDDIMTSQFDAFQHLTAKLSARAILTSAISASVMSPTAAPTAALFIDYGQLETGPGDTLQAVRAHAWEHPLTSPGEADLTVHVDFEVFGALARSHGFVVDGPTTQAEFLGSLGIVERASKLMSANPTEANTIEMATARLIGPGAMGTRFKVIGLRSPFLPPLPGF
jgi:NADH dehydrogenase [ubiquinone] 1 alpha subcomplex assembly factor 7